MCTFYVYAHIVVGMTTSARSMVFSIKLCNNHFISSTDFRVSPCLRFFFAIQKPLSINVLQFAKVPGLAQLW